MRRGEILNLCASRIDLKEGFIRLRPEETKTGSGRSIPIHPELMEVLRNALRVRPLNSDRVFHRGGEPIDSGDVRRAHERACRNAEIEHFHFHDFRHTCINDWRKKGHDYFKIMAASGHKTISVFKRYNMVDEEELKSLVKSWSNPSSNPSVSQPALISQSVDSIGAGGRGRTDMDTRSAGF